MDSVNDIIASHCDKRYINANGELTLGEELATDLKQDEITEDSKDKPRSYDPKDEPKLAKKLSSLLIDVNTPCDPPEFLLQDTNGITTFPTENLQMIVAPFKSGKTTLGAILMASVLGGGERFGLKALKANATILHLDTEQAVYDQVAVLNYIEELCGYDPKDRLRSIHLRSEPIKERMQIAEYAIRTLRPTFVYIDGIKELCSDINDNAECTELIQKLEAFADIYKCAITNVIHTNKDVINTIRTNKENKEFTFLLPRGALGTELQNKVSDGIQLTKEPGFNIFGEKINIFTANHYVSRHREIMDVIFERDFHNQGIPIPHQGTPPPQEETPIPKQNGAFDKCLVWEGKVAIILFSAINHEMTTTQLQSELAKSLGVKPKSLEHYWYNTFVPYMADKWTVCERQVGKGAKSKFYKITDFSNYQV